MDKEIESMIEGTDFEKNMYRSKRKRLLSAFDKYKTNVEYGIEVETEEQHDIIVQWYQSLLDMEDINKMAFEMIPERIAYYMGGE